VQLGFSHNRLILPRIHEHKRRKERKMKVKAMTPTMRTVIGIGLTAAISVASSPAWSQSLIGDGESWELRDRMAYTVHPTGKMRALPIGDKGMAMMIKRAKPVPRGTVFFTRNGQLYMMRGGGAYDRAGNWKGHL
jgi:hypothetical protein